MKTVTLKPNQHLKVGAKTYWNVVAAPCASALTGPTPISVGWVMVPPGTWQISKALTVVALAK